MSLKKDLNELESSLEALDSQLGGIGGKLKSELIGNISRMDDAVKKTAQSFANDLSRSISKSNSSLNSQNVIIDKIRRGQNASKDIEKELLKIQKEKAVSLRKIENLKKEGVRLDEEALYDLEQTLNSQEQQLQQLNEINTAQLSSKGLTGNILENLKEYVVSLDKSGLAAKLFNGELNSAQKISLLAEASLIAIAKGTLEASDNINNLQKNLGLSYQESLKIQAELALSAASSEKLFVNSKDLNQSFRELTTQTGLIADFGGDILVTQTTLTKQLGLSAENAGRLSTLSRIQSKDTETILENSVSTVSALGAQNKVGIDVKGVLQEVSQVSDAIAVSLGKNPVEIAKAVTQAKLLGLSLSEVDAVASSLLDFESSITNELEAELLIGKDLNLEKARLLALNNDLAGLGDELRNQEEIRLSFSTGNRIQQEAAAKAIGVSRDQLAKMVLQQDLIAMGAENFVDAYGEQTFQSLQSQSASEKFAATLEKIQGIIGDIGIAFAPFLDGIASVVGYLAQSKVAAIALGSVIAGLAAASLTNAIASIFASTALLGPVGVGIGAAAVTGMIATISSAKNMVTADDMIAPPGYGDRILSTPKGSIALNNQDTIVAGTNLGGGNGMVETNKLLKQILNKQGTVKIDSVNAGTAFAMGTYQVQ